MVDFSDFDQWISSVSDWQEQTSIVPAKVREDISKGRFKIENPAQGMKALVEDPYSLQYAMGYKDRRYSLSYDVLKRIPHQLSIIGAILHARANQVAAFSVPFRASKNVGFVIKHKDPSHLTTKSEQKFIKELETFIYSCGSKEPNPHNKFKRDDFETFLKKIVRDSLTFDQCTFEIVPDRRGQPYEFMAVDASTVRIAAPNSIFGPNYKDKEGSSNQSGPLIHNVGGTNTPYRSMQMMYNRVKNPDYVQIVNGQIENVFDREELAFGVRNPRTDIYIQGYGYGELEQLITVVTSHLYAEEYNRRFFSQGSAPKGILNFKGDAMTPDQLEAFKRQWRAQLEGVENCLSGDTRIYTIENGFDSLSNICGEKSEVPVVLWTGTDWASGLVYRTSEPKKLCHIYLDNGSSIDSSPDHKFMVVGEEGEPEWKLQKNIEEGDILLLNKEDPFNREIELNKRDGWLTNYNTASVVSVSSSSLFVPMYDVSVNTEDHAFVANNIVCHNSWKTPILQSEGGIEWQDLQPTNREMEFNAWIEYLIKVTCALYLIDPAELNFDLHGGVQQTPLFESSQEWKLKASKDKGLKPLLRFIAKLINEHIVSKIDDHFVFDFVGLDELTEQEKHQLRTEQVSSYRTLNEVRREDDLPDLEYGDMPMNPTYLQAMQTKSQMEQAEQQQSAEAPPQGSPAGGEEEKEGEAAAPEQESPQYSDGFVKSISSHLDGSKILEIDLSDLDAWKRELL